LRPLRERNASGFGWNPQHGVLF